MEITLHLKPEVEAQLISQATAQGLSIEQLLEQMIEGLIVTPYSIEVSGNNSLTDEVWRSILNQLGRNPSPARLPSLSDAAISRESIYGEREERQL